MQVSEKRVREIAEETGLTPAQIAIVLSHVCIDVVDDEGFLLRPDSSEVDIIR